MPPGESARFRFCLFVLSPVSSAVHTRAEVVDQDGLCAWVRVRGCALSHVPAIFCHSLGPSVLAPDTPLPSWTVPMGEKSI